MGVEASIADALQRRLSLFQHTPELPIAWPGLPFTPPAGPYLVASFLPNRTVDNPIRDEDQPARQGLFQVSVIWPVGQGIIAPTRVASAVVEHFRRVRLPINGWLVRVTEAPWLAPPIQEANRLQIPVTVPWMAHEL